jgi:predicted DNA-binding transcriptional regulator YafY
MSDYLKRLSILVFILKSNAYTSEDLLKLLNEKNFTVSQRQLQRDLKSIEQAILTDQDQLKSYFLDSKKYFYIRTLSKPSHDFLGFNSSHTSHTRFYHQDLNFSKIELLESIETAIHQKRSLEVGFIQDDETGDNLFLDTTQLFVCPVQIIYHRSSYYVACFNIKTEKPEVFGIRQLTHVNLGRSSSDFETLKQVVDIELDKRFGVTKNIDDKCYDIEIEFTSALGRFIEDHHWHPSQKVRKVNGNYQLTMYCGINRELMGWLFQWMYNAKVINPPLLKTLYQKALKECESTAKGKIPFMYRNIFFN